MREAIALTREAFTHWTADDAAGMGAALAFYTLFSMAPLLLLVIAIAGLVVGTDAARGLIDTQLTELLGENGAKAVGAVLQAADQPRKGWIAAGIGMATLIFGATTVLAELRKDLDKIWHVQARVSGVRKLLSARLTAFAVVLAIGFLLLVSLALSAVLSAVTAAWAGAFPGLAFTLRALDLGVSFIVMTGLFAMIYKILPTARIEWRDVWVGAAITSLLFAMGKWLIGLYLGRSAIESPFGAAGTLVVVIVWVYYSAQIFFLGAEFTRAFGARRPSSR